MKESKNFIRIFFVTVGGFLLSISIFNYLVDPLSVFTESNNQSREYKLAQLLTNHPNVIATNMDERKFVKARVNIESIKFDPRIIVVGSSRVLQLGNNILEKNVLNFGVSGASLEDKIAILDIATSKFNPKILIVGADPWIFNEASGQTRWQTLFDEYYSALADLELNSKVEIIKKKKNYEQLISLAYTKESLSYAYKKFLNNEDEDEDEDEDKYENIQYLDSDQPLPNKNIIRRDGTLVYNLKYANQNEDIKIRDSKKWANFSLNPYYFSNKRQEIFEAFLQRYKKDYEVIMFLTPYHPAAYYDFLLNDSVILEMEKKFRAIAKLHDIRILGSYNPEKYACKGADFFDGAHPKVSCMDKVISLDGPL